MSWKLPFFSYSDRKLSDCKEKSYQCKFINMNQSNNFSREKPENSSMATVNILGRLRMTTEQVRKIQLNLANDG